MTQHSSKFVEGSIMGHVIVMTATSSVGIFAIFAVDFANLFYLSLLGEQELAAAIGYAGTIMFFTVSASIGMMIATSAGVAKALGQGDRTKAQRYAMASLAFILLCTVVMCVGIIPLLPSLLSLLGAEGRTHQIAEGFLVIVLPSLPLLGIGMALAGILRALGDAKRAMYVTLGGGAASAVLDPILIFYFDLGITGAAIAVVISRVVFVCIGFYSLIKTHQMVCIPRLNEILTSAKPFFIIAVPAILTNLATPVGNAYVTYSIAQYGDAAVAGWAIIGRMIPLAFGIIFALSGAVGPIIGQNYGALRYDRIHRTLIDSLIFTTVYTGIMWLILFLFRFQIASVFSAAGQTEELIIFFCTFVAGSFLFNGALFVASAAFNNLDHPFLSTLFNWGRATLGVLPFVWIGAHFYGVLGVLAGWGLGAIIFGISGFIICLRVVNKLPQTHPTPDPNDDAKPAMTQVGLHPFTSGKGAGQ